MYKNQSIKPFLRLAVRYKVWFGTKLQKLPIGTNQLIIRQKKYMKIGHPVSHSNKPASYDIYFHLRERIWDVLKKPFSVEKGTTKGII